jgi:hypothetical protein
LRIDIDLSGQLSIADNNLTVKGAESDESKGL